KEVDVQFVGGHDPAIILQGLVPLGFGFVADKGNTVDFQFLRGGEELHIDGVVEQGIDDGTLFNDEIVQLRLFGLQPTGDADGAPTDDQKVELLHYCVLSFRSWIVARESALLKTKLPATRISAPAETSFAALSALTPPSISIRALDPLRRISSLISITFW